MQFRPDSGPSDRAEAHETVPGSPPETSRPELDLRLRRLRDSSRPFARLAVGEKALLLRAIAARFFELAPNMSALGARAKGLDPRGPLAGEEWFSGAALSLRALRLFAHALEEVAAHGAPRVRFSHSRSGRPRAILTPLDAYDRALFIGWKCEARLRPQLTAEDAAASQARFYHQQRDPEGRVVLVLGAGNVGSISVLDVLYHSFVEGAVCLLKMSPVNAYLGPLYERAFEPLIARGFFSVVYGGSEVGEYLVGHELIDALHVTGAAETHDRIVWGADDAAREARKAAGRPLFTRPVSSELGNVSPVLVVPARYDDRELDAAARNIAGMVMHNASFNCNAAKMIVTAKSWAQRDELLERIARVFSSHPPRLAYYPGAQHRYDALTASAARDRVLRFGEGVPGALPWTLIRDLSPGSASPLFRTEPFCSIVSEVALGSDGVEEFLAQAAWFANEELWGTLNAMIIVPDRLSRDEPVRAALDSAVSTLRYGTVSLNVWPAVAFGLGAPPWGGYPGATLADVQSGIGWGHNALLLEGVEKVVLEGPLLGFPQPFWYPGHAHLRELGESLAAIEAGPSVSGVLRAAWAALRR